MIKDPPSEYHASMIVPILRWRDLDEEHRTSIISRAEEDIHRLLPEARSIVLEVKSRRDEAVREFNHKFDGVDPDLPLRLSEKDIDEAVSRLSPDLVRALDYVIENVQNFHRIQKPLSMDFTEVRPGILAGERWLALDSVGLYVPRGKGSFPSMVYMLAVPAVLAGVKRVVLVTPPHPDGSVDPACLYAARRCGVHEVFRVGGAHAIAALAYGTPSIPKVDKIVGPASSFVTAAKRLVADLVDVGLPAGPSESVILADETADARLLALDLLVEAEHGPDSCAFLATDSMELAQKVQTLAEHHILETPQPRRTYLEKSFERYGAILVFDTIEEAADWVNIFAPEHLSIQTSEPFAALHLIKHAGEILLGPHLPFSAANYATGPNAVLPTGGRARTWGPVSVRDFMKASSIVSLTRAGFENLAPHVQVLADYEGFPSHKRAVQDRFS